VPDPRFFEALGPISLGELAQLTGSVLGDADDAGRSIAAVGVLGHAAPEEVGFFDEARRAGLPSRSELLRNSSAGACFIHRENLDIVPPGCAALVCPSPRAAWALASERLHRPRRVEPNAPPTHPSAVLEPGVEIAPGAVVGQGAQIGARTTIAAGAVIGPGVAIGRDCQIGSNAVIACALVGDRVKIYAGVVIGEAGFGVTAGPRGLIDIPQLGRVILQDGVTVGSNSCIDRGAFDDTVIGENTKIDNLVQIAHNVTIGRNCVIVACTGISGSVSIGDGAQLGGGAGIADNVTIGAGARLAARIGVFRNVPAGESWGGFPGRPLLQWLREVAWLEKAATGRRKSGGKG
jgi:UDP-3-O-[3-hydroxymyristoyl] glucosamine N-acyltransferase